MRIALIAESFLPHMNGVTGSVLQVDQHLRQAGHEVLIIAPRSPQVPAGDSSAARVTSVPLPSYPDVRVGVPSARRIRTMLAEFDPDVVHLASPFVLGWQGLLAADALRLPTVAVYQTDVVAYTERYGLSGATRMAASHVARLHRRATLTLAPSSAAEEHLTTLGVDRLRRWGRGVDTVRFHPDHRSEAWRTQIAPGELLIGFVGRLAPEKQVADLAVLSRIPGARLVIVGDGPDRADLERALPDAVFTGFLGGAQLARAMASFDVFVHPGESETFCQTVQEAQASGVPVVATGRGGPVDLVRSSIDGWLYRPGDLDDLFARVTDLLGDAAKRHSFAAAASDGVRQRTWDALTGQLAGHFREAIQLRRVDDALVVRGPSRPELRGSSLPGARVDRFIALGDSITEGLCDASRMPTGRYRGWADRLAALLAQDSSTTQPLRFANLAVRSRRMQDLRTEQAPRAIAMRPDFVTVLMGANDLVRRHADPVALGIELEGVVRALRAHDIRVLLVTPFLPRRRPARLLAGRFARFAHEVRRIAREHGCLLLDAEAHPTLGDPTMFAEDRVHLSSRGHRALTYLAAEILGVPDAGTLSELDDAFHDEGNAPRRGWWRRHALPWAWRRLHGRTAGDGVNPKHEDYVLLPRRTSDRSPHQV